MDVDETCFHPGFFLMQLQYLHLDLFNLHRNAPSSIELLFGLQSVPPRAQRCSLVAPLLGNVIRHARERYANKKETQ